MLIFVVALAFCTPAMASDIAISTQAGWMSQTHADNESQEIVNNVKGVSIQVFTPTQLDALATWVKDHTGDGTADLLIMFGNFPSTIYPAGNAQPNGSIAELFLDDGNVIINTGDYIFYVGSNGNNDAGGLTNMMDVPGAAMWGDDSLATTFAPTADGQLYTPSLTTLPSNRPWFPAQFAGTNWEVELILAQNSAGTQVHPAILHNTVTDGRLGVFFQWNSDTPPRGEVISEWINNWFLQFVAGGNPYARRPNPKDGATHVDTWISLSWTAGDFAVSHDVYLGESFADVNSGAAATFRGNQVGTYYVAGFPGFAYPDGLIPGTTYYWRVDEVNTANPKSPWRGPVWSFSIPPKKAYNPSPADGSKFIATTDLTLSWTLGFGAKLHTVYFGDNLDTVTNAVGGVPQGTTTYKPGVLEAAKTYYWRVDEFEGPATHKGDVWSFTTGKVGGGVKGQYFKGMDFNTLVLTRTDPQINFNWGDPGGPDPVVGNDQFSARWTGEVEAAFTETYTFYASADDGVRLWIDGKQLVDAWIDQGTTEYRGTIDLVAGNTYSLQMEYYENGGGAVAELRWSSPRTPKQLVPQAALSPPVKASGPNPGNGATGTSLTPVLTWSPGDFAASHDVYFGTVADAVKNATKASAEYKGSKALGAESYNPGKLAWYTTYYWRVDEVNAVHPDSPWVGNLWSFTTGDFLLIDDFESYDTGDNQIWYAWHDGLGYGAPGTPPYFAGNGTGAAVGDETTASFTEETIVHGGRKAMPLSYDNNKQGFAKYSEAEFKLTAPRDWTEESVGELSIWFRGLPGSVGSFVEAPAGTYTMTASGTDIWDVGAAGNYRDEFHFAYKTLTGAGSIVAKVQSVQNTNAWSKAGVMIRETLDAGSKHAFACVTPSNGVGSQGRDTTGAASFNTNQTGLTAPYWVKLERDAAGNFTVTHSANGTAWSPVTGATPRNIPMATTVYIGLALTSHDAALTCQAVFTNVTTTGTVSPQWAHQDIGIASNAAEPLYVAVSNAAGQPAVVVHPDPKAAQITTWTEWVVPLQSLTGITLTNVDRIAVGLGTRGNMTTAGGSGKMYFDDIRLYRPRTAP
jgi:regulation of enolase protein 1 (concanavalin A-like superfamily)